MPSSFSHDGKQAKSKRVIILSQDISIPFSQLCPEGNKTFPLYFFPVLFLTTSITTQFQLAAPVLDNVTFQLCRDLETVIKHSSKNKNKIESKWTVLRSMGERQLAELHCTEASCQAPQGMPSGSTGGITAVVADSHIPGYRLKSILHT